MRRFSVRDLIWFTTLVAVGAAWYADHRQQRLVVHQQRAASVAAALQVQDQWLARYRGEIPPSP
jgi:hypothetical protein